MGVLERWVERRNTDYLSTVLSLGWGTTAAGVSVTEESSLRSSAVFACVRIISESIASLPLVLYRRAGRNKERATNHPLYPVLHDLANREMTSLEWRETTFAHVLLWGNAYSEIETDARGVVRGLWPLRPDRMTVQRGPDGALRYRYQLPDGGETTLPAYRVHHVRGLSPDGIIGYSPILLAARQAVGLALATEEFGARFFSNGARPGLVVKHPGALKDAAYKRLKESWGEDHQGLSNSHRVKILEEGMDIATIGVPPEEAQFLETRKFQVTEIARIYRVPPHMLADLDRATFSNIEHQSLEFVTYTLRPWLVRHEQAISRDLLKAPEREEYMARYVVEGLLRGDTKNRYEAYTAAIVNGWMTRNEVRELEDMNPADGLDEYLLPLNMGSQDQEAEGGEAPRWDALIDDIAARAARREVADLDRQGRKHAADPDEWRVWLDDFYVDESRWLLEYWRPLYVAQGRGLDQLTERVERCAAQGRAAMAERPEDWGQWAEMRARQMREVADE